MILLMKPQTPHGNTITVRVWVGATTETLRPKGQFCVTLEEWEQIREGKVQ